MTNTISKKCLFGGTILAAGLTAAAQAQFSLYFTDSDPSGWASAISGKILCPDPTDFSNGGVNYPILGLIGPVDNTGNGPVAPGAVADYVSLNSALAGNYFYNMVSVGPQYGFGNASNFIGANYFVDWFTMDFDDGKCAVRFTGATLLGSNLVDIIVTDQGGNQTVFNGVNVGAGTNIGIVGNTNIARIELLDVGGGAEGIMGTMDAWAIPAPGALALLGFGGLVATRRRR